MDNKEKYSYWEDIADYDLGTAEAMLLSGRYLYVVFMCQQAVEKLTKGLLVLHKGEEPPRTHNIWSVFDRTFDIDRFEEKEKTVAENYFSFFDELLAYYISERYPSYKEKLSESITKEKASEVLNKSKEVISWLKSLRTLEI
ncbi:HEPN domain-containing protein [Proteiniborus sp.]|uniref:HEPN domain-containing protein n=1 Tax=Proteiniborus sp. TaxID=2079015 RepID=UPI003325AC57